MKSGPQFAAVTIKSLQKRYGSYVDYYAPIAKSTDLATGKVTIQYNSQAALRGLLLPVTLTRGFIYDTAYLGAGNGDAKNFSFGAFHDKNESSLIIRFKQLKLIPKMDDFVALLGKRFDVKNIEAYPDMDLYVLTVARTQSLKDFYMRATNSVYFQGGDSLV